jgi:hypothetical protein
MAANYTKRNERSAEIAGAMQDYARRPPSEPPRYACSVCGIEKADGVPLWALSERRRHTLLCTEHIPEEWRPTPEQIERARLRAHF